jgi:hypothetical protein
MKQAGRKIVILFFVAMLWLSGCNTKENNDTKENNNAAESTAEKEEVFVDSAQKVLEKVVNNSQIEVGMTFSEAVTAENSTSLLGLSQEDFNTYVDEAYTSVAALTTHAHLTAVVKCKDADGAKAVKERIASGFDSGRWICVFPEESFVVESGSYVFLAATQKENAQLLKESFEKAAGNSAGTVAVFYTGKEG